MVPRGGHHAQFDRRSELGGVNDDAFHACLPTSQRSLCYARLFATRSHSTRRSLRIGRLSVRADVRSTFYSVCFRRKPSLLQLTLAIAQ